MTAFAFLLFGLVVGSFLNVLIYRYPVMLQRGWSEDLALANGQTPPTHDPFNLWVPRSRCGSCGHVLGWVENIPLFSYFRQAGACAHCGAHIPLRYPIVEALTGLLFLFSALVHDSTWTAAGVALACSFLVALAFIDLDEMLLPDQLTFGLMWLGFGLALTGHALVSPEGAILGAMVGFVILWAPARAYEFVTGRDGMGGGDLKYAAAIGAWVGPYAMVYCLVVASVASVVISGAMMLWRRRQPGASGGGATLPAGETGGWRQQYPFGPFLSIGALFGLFFPPSLFNY